MEIPFIKYEGCGNDFVLLDFSFGVKAKSILRQVELPLFKKWIARLADRHFGVGADQVILILSGSLKTKPKGAEGISGQVIFFNADGSRAEICGNGLRAAALYLVERGSRTLKVGSSKPVHVRMETDTGLRIAQVSKIQWQSGVRVRFQSQYSRQSRARLAASGFVQVAMGVPQLMGSRSLRDPLARRRTKAAGVGGKYEAISMGNPHAVFFKSQDDKDLYSTGEARLRAFGAQVEHAHDFPNRTNVEWVMPVRRKLLRVWIWERGVGPTLACGSGACASAVAAMQRGLVDPGSVEVQMPGGSVWVSWDKGHESPCLLAGPVNRVFTGILPDQLKRPLVR